MRKSLVRAAIFACVVGQPVTEAWAGPHDAAIEAILVDAATEWTTYLSCSVLDPNEHASVVGWWQEEVAEVAELMVEANVAPKVADRLVADLAPDRLMTLTTGDAAALIEFCAAEAEWRRRFALLDITLPTREIERLINP